MPTIRQQIIEILKQQKATPLELADAIGLKEKEVYDHLEHIRRSAGAQKLRLHVQPYHCVSCGFEFKDRKRLSRPGRCPKCKSQRIDPATFQILSPKQESRTI